jgi:prephenate dehydrogenase
VALAARSRGVAGEVALWARRPEAVEALRSRAVAEVVSNDLSEVVDGAELVVLATPVGAVAGLLQEILPKLASGARVTDLCSVKAAVVAAADAAVTACGREDIAFVGAHPMAGSDRTGFEHARADLFVGAPCAITPGVCSDPEATVAVGEFWKSLGCVTLEMTAAEHDCRVARISHLPHIAASALVLASIGAQPEAADLAGPGFRDTTRVAAGAAGMWAEILGENRVEVASALESYIEELGEVLANLRDMDNGELHRFLDEARTRRSALYPAADSGSKGGRGQG